MNPSPTSCLWLCALVACSTPRAPHAAATPAAPTAHCPELGPPAWSAPPPWLHDLVSRGLYVRDAGVPVDAPADDVAVLRTYLDGRGLGPLQDGSRITLLAARRVFAVNEPVRVVHVLEHTLAGHTLYVMGPKVVTGEQVDDAPSPSSVADGMPETYDGVVLASPGADTNFERTVYRFARPGLHHIQWRHAGLASNVLCVEVTPPPRPSPQIVGRVPALTPAAARPSPKDGRGAVLVANRT